MSTSSSFIFFSEVTSSFKDSQIVAAFFSIILVFFVIEFARKIFFKAYYSKNYQIFPTLTTRNITKIAMIIAMNSALIGVISWLSSGVLGALFQVYPGTRMFIENTLIKIGGIFFGPVLGIFIGAVTDLLTVILTGSVINYGYWMVAIINGFLGGIIYLLINLKDSKHIKSTSLTVLLSVLFLVFFDYFLNANVTETWIKVNIFSANISIAKNTVFLIILLFTLGIVGMLIMSLLSNFLIIQENYKNNKLVKWFSKNNIFLQIFCINFIFIAIIDVVALPIFDQKISTLPYQQFLIMRLIWLPFYLTVSTIITWNIYKLNFKLKPIKPKVEKVNENNSTCFDYKNCAVTNPQNKKINSFPNTLITK